MLYFRRPELGPNQSSLDPIIVLIHEGLDLPRYSETEPYPVFNMGTYNTMTKEQSRATGDAILQHLNQFLETFSPDEQKYIYQYFISTKQAMDRLQLEALSIQKLTDELTVMTTTLMSQLQFAEKARNLVLQIVTLPDLGYVGSQAHYTKELTFDDPDYYDLTAMGLLCKFMCPVWGEFISRLRDDGYIDPVSKQGTAQIDERNNKELFCSTMIQPSLESGPLGFIYSKLQNYMANIIRQVIRQMEKTSGPAQPPIDFVMAKYGYTLDRFQDFVCSMLLVKRIVAFDSDQIINGGRANIATHTNVVINQTATAQLKRMRGETRTMTRNEVSDGGTDPDNTSHTENMSKISLVTADIPIAVVYGVQQQIPRLLAQHQLPVELYGQMLAYYRRRMTSYIAPSTFNQALMASLHARWVGGSALLRYLDFDTYVQLLSYTQLYLLCHKVPTREGGFHHPWIQLAVYMTCRTDPILLNLTRPEGRRIRGNVKNSGEFNRVTSLYPGSAEKQIAPYGQTVGVRKRNELVEHVNIVQHIERLMTWVIDYEHYTEFAPVLLSILPESWQGRVVPEAPLYYDEHIIQEVCAFFLEQHGNPSPTP